MVRVEANCEFGLFLPNFLGFRVSKFVRMCDKINADCAFFISFVWQNNFLHPTTISVCVIVRVRQAGYMERPNKPGVSDVLLCLVMLAYKVSRHRITFQSLLSW